MRVLWPEFPRYLPHSINIPSHAHCPEHDHRDVYGWTARNLQREPCISHDVRGKIAKLVVVRRLDAQKAVSPQRGFFPLHDLPSEPRRAAARRPACCPRQAPRVSTRSPDGDPRFCVRSARAGVGAPAAPEFAALRASGLRAGEEGGGAGTAAPRPTRALEGRGQQGDARAAAGRQSAAAGRRYARTSAARPRCAISRARFLLCLLLPSILLFAETTILGCQAAVPWQERR